jgi:hypothetical protein
LQKLPPTGIEQGTRKKTQPPSNLSTKEITWRKHIFAPSPTHSALVPLLAHPKTLNGIKLIRKKWPMCNHVHTNSDLSEGQLLFTYVYLERPQTSQIGVLRMLRETKNAQGYNSTKIRAGNLGLEILKKYEKWRSGNPKRKKNKK